MGNKAKRRNLEAIILDRLKDGAVNVRDVIEYARERRGGATKQGVYAALRKLHNEEKITLHGKKASLNTIWIEQMLEYFSIVAHNYADKNIRDNGFAYLSEGERVQYVFRNPVHADTFWSHALLILTSAAPLEEDLYIYCPHEWFLLARPKSERMLLGSIVSRGRRLREVVGHRNSLDHYIAKEFGHERMSYKMMARPPFKREDYYVNVVGGYVIETYLAANVVEKLHAFFLSTRGWSPNVQTEMEKIIVLPGKTKIVISKNAKKAARLIALLGK